MPELKNSLYVVNSVGKNNKPYSALVLESNGYKKFLSFDRFYICSLLNCSPTQLLDIPNDTAKIITRW